MAKIKFDPSAIPLNNEHDGYTFQRNNYGFSMFPAGRNARKRYERQFLRMHPNQKAVTQWRNMPQSVKDLWTLFASTFPQPAQKDPDQFLNGFECFVKRNYFCFLNHGIHSDFMLEPDLVVNTGEPITFAIKAETTAIECAELYIKNFGLLPQVGDKLLLYAAVYCEYTGHFYESINTYAIVEEIYIDSMQIAVYIPDTFNDVTVSVYLSKPVSKGVSYVGTKIRYMGCFTTKKIVQLQDVNITNITNEGNVLVFEGDTEEVTNITYGDLIEIIKKTDCGTVVYDENTEWTAGPTGSYFDFENESEVFNKTKSIQVLNCPSNSVIGFESGAEIATDTYAAVVLYIKLMAEMPSNLDVKLLFLYEDEHHSNQIALSINKTLLDEWQPLLVPLSLFTFDGPTFTGIQLFLTIDTGSAIFPEMYIDYIALMETEAEPDCTCFCKPIPEVDYPLPEPIPGEAGQPVVVNPDGDGYEPGNFPAPTNAFNPVNVDGQTPVTADNPAEPVEFVAGTNITILTSNVPKRITFSAAGGSGGGGANYGSEGENVTDNAYIAKYVTTDIPVTFRRVALEITAVAWKVNNDIKDFFQARLYLDYDGSTLKKSFVVVTPFNVPSAFITMTAVISFSEFRFLFMFDGTKLEIGGHLELSWRLLSADLSKTWPASFP